jgi:hypothetical protein
MQWLITNFPPWIVKKKMGQHKKRVLFLTAVVVVVSLLSA